MSAHDLRGPVRGRQKLSVNLEPNSVLREPTGGPHEL